MDDGVPLLDLLHGHDDSNAHATRALRTFFQEAGAPPREITPDVNTFVVHFRDPVSPNVRQRAEKELGAVFPRTTEAGVPTSTLLSELHRLNAEQRRAESLRRTLRTVLIVAAAVLFFLFVALL
jgi:hypothetical protein